MKYGSSIYNMIAVPIGKVRPNNYNLNKVTPPEMRPLCEGIKENGHTMPVVYYYAEAQDVCLTVDGFHRYRMMLDHPDICERKQGMLPVSIIEEPIDKQMVSTMRHNRAHGSHNVGLTNNIVKEPHEFGRSGAWIAKHLGMDRDGISRLRQITGFAVLFRDTKSGRARCSVEE